MMDNTTLELEALRAERAALEVLTPWGDSLDLFARNGIDPDLLSEDLQFKLFDYIAGKTSSGKAQDLPLLIWLFSADGVARKVVEEHQTYFSHRTQYAPLGAPQGIETIGHPRVSDSVRIVALDADTRNADYLSSDQIEAVWKELDNFTVRLLIRGGELRPGRETLGIVLRSIVGLDDEASIYWVAAEALSFDALFPEVSTTDELSALIRVTMDDLELNQIKIALQSEHADSQILFEILDGIDSLKLVEALELAAASASYEGVRKEAQQLLDLRSERIDGEPDPQLAVRARNARRRLKGDSRSFAEFLEAEVAYRSYEEPYQRIAKTFAAGASELGSDELNYELSRSIKQATDGALRVRAIRSAVKKWLEAFRD